MKHPRNLRVFISLPMSRETDETFYVNKTRLEEYIIDSLDKMNYKYDTIQFINTFIDKSDSACKTEAQKRYWMIGNAFNKMSTCHIVVFSKDYKDARGCIVEKGVCELYDFPHIIEGDTVDRFDIELQKSFQ